MACHCKHPERRRSERLYSNHAFGAWRFEGKALDVGLRQLAISRPAEETLVPQNSGEPKREPHRLALHPALWDFGLTGSTSLVTALAAMVVISLVGKTLGPELLGEYLLIRRMASWLQAGVQLPSGVALPRYVASSVDQTRSTKQTYFLSALLTAFGIALLLAVILMLWRDALSRAFFGSAQLDHLVFPLVLLLFGLAVHGAVFGYYQGALAMGRACSLQLMNFAFVPVLMTVLLRRGHSIVLIVNAIGLSMIIGALLFAFPIVRRLDFHVAAKELKRRASELFSYGFYRVSGDFGLQALLSLPAVIAAHYLPISAVAFLLLGGSFLTMVAAATFPLGIILLSRVSRSVAQQRTSQLQVRLKYFISAIIQLSVFLCLQMIVFSDAIIRFWVGPGFLAGLPVVRIVILALPFYFLYAGLRSVIDAAAVKAHNTNNILISLVIFSAFVALVKASVARDHLLDGLALSCVIGLAVLAICTWRTLRKLFEIDLKWAQILPGLGLGLILGILSFSLRRWLDYQPGIFGLFLFETTVSAVYFILLRLVGSPWVPFLLEMMLLRIPHEQGFFE